MSNDQTGRGNSIRLIDKIVGLIADYLATNSSKAPKK